MRLSELFCVVLCELYTVISTLRWAVLTVLWIGFCHTGLISLCIDLFAFMCSNFVCFCFILHICHNIVSVVGWTWCDWSLILRTYLPSVLRHCWLGHLTCKNPSPIWPIMCLVGFWTLLNLLYLIFIFSPSLYWCCWLIRTFPFSRSCGTFWGTHCSSWKIRLVKQKWEVTGSFCVNVCVEARQLTCTMLTTECLSTHVHTAVRQHAQPPDKVLLTAYY